MRYLNKVILINSANVPYEEVLLDGNIHFIGTQGVGKSTLLRAILFFYNVNKTGLGLRPQSKHKSFDEFYLPYPNSYIIYEVMRETGPFFIVVFRRGVRASYRIVDCAYDKSFFVHSDGSVLYEWSEISRAIGLRVFKSNVIRANEELLDIIYGNSGAVDRDLRRFSLMESPKYQNVPRTIQNIFLNQGLESEFIKRTIIDSMDYSSDTVDLNFYREHLKDFKLQYEDIWKWYRIEKDGRIKVRIHSAHVLESFSEYEAASVAISTLCEQIRYALRRDTEALPQLDSDIATQSERLEKKQAVLADEGSRYSRERDRLNRDSGAVEASLDDIKRKLQRFQDDGIDDVVARVEQESILKTIREQILGEREVLLAHHRSVEERYGRLIDDENRVLEIQRTEARQHILISDGEALSAKTEEIERCNARSEEIRLAAEAEIANISDTERELRKALQDYKLDEQRTLTANPLSERFEEVERRGSELSAQLAESERISHECATRAQSLRTEAERTISAKKAELDKDLLNITHERKSVQKELDRIKELQERQNDSLIGWLEKNMPGWEDSIGVVLDEDNVLYNTDLAPHFINDGGHSIFGVSIDTTKIDRRLLTPEALRRQRETLAETLRAIENREAGLIRQYESAADAINRKLRKELAEVNVEKAPADLVIRTAPAQLKKIENDKRKLDEALEQLRSESLADVRKRISGVTKKLAELTKRLAYIRSRRDAELKALKKESERFIKTIEASADEKKAVWTKLIKDRETEAQSRIAKYRADMHRELEGDGVDMGRLDALNIELQRIAAELDFIENHKADYIRWKSFCKDDRCREPELYERKKKLRKELDLLSHRYEQRRSRLEADIDHAKAALGELKRRRGNMANTIESFNAFISGTSCPTEWLKAVAKKTAEPLDELIGSLQHHIYARMQLLEGFKEAVNTFKRNFSVQNTFHFRVQLDSSADYIEFATNLSEFINNNKIEEYRQRVSTHYAGIINYIAKQMGRLGAHRAEIVNTINEINRDFRESNFVGAIKDIELRAVDNTDKLVVMFQRIKEFADENADNLGESLNLFSTESDLSRINRQAVEKIMSLIDLLDANIKRDKLTLEDSFKLEFKVRENDNDTTWVERLANVGSDGTDILVKAMVNIMLINVFKKKISRKFGDFRLHCMMDEIGKLHPNNVAGILRFANERNICLINSSPTAYNASAYRHTYELYKNADNKTHIRLLLTVK